MARLQTLPLAEKYLFYISDSSNSKLVSYGQDVMFRLIYPQLGIGIRTRMEPSLLILSVFVQVFLKFKDADETEQYQSYLAGNRIHFSDVKAA